MPGAFAFTDEKKFNAYIKAQKSHTAPAEMKLEHFQAMYDLVLRNSALMAGYNTLIRHLMMGGVKLGKTGLKFMREITQVDLQEHFQVYNERVLAHLYTYGIAFSTVSSDDELTPISLDPKELVVTVSIVGSHQRVYLVTSRLPFIQKTTVGPTQKPAAAAASSASPFDTVAPGKKHEFPWVIVHEDAEVDSMTLKMVSHLEALSQIESLNNSTVANTIKADARRSDPTLLLRKDQPTLTDQRVDRDLAYPGSGPEAARQRVQQSEAFAQAQFHADNQVNTARAETDRLKRQMQDIVRKLTPSKDEVSNGPRYSDAPQPDVRRETVEAGYTPVAAPAAEVPPHLIALQEFMRESSGELVGVPPALFGSARSAIAVNQTVLNTLSATLQRWRGVLTNLSRRVFFKIYEQRILELTATAIAERRKRLRRKADDSQPGLSTTKPGTLEHLQDRDVDPEDAIFIAEQDAIKQQYMLDISFEGFADPLTAKQWYEMEVTNEQTFAEQTAAYSGLPITNFDVKRMSESYALKRRLDELKVEQEELVVEKLRLEVKAAKQALDAGAMQAALATARTTRAGSKRKTPSSDTTYENLEGVSVDRNSRHGGKMGTGLLAAKVKRPTTGRGAHAR